VVECCWRCASPCVLAKNLPRPGDGVFDPDPGRLWSHPQFQILKPVIVPDSVAVMHRFVRHEMSTEGRLHDEDVLKDVAALACTRMRPISDYHVAVGVVPTPAFPAPVELISLRPALEAGLGLHLFDPAALAPRLGSTCRTSKMSAGRSEDPLALAARPVPHETILAGRNALTKTGQIGKRCDTRRSMQCEMEARRGAVRIPPPPLFPRRHGTAGRSCGGCVRRRADDSLLVVVHRPAFVESFSERRLDDPHP
jgi:hypothetical protein